MLIQKEPKKPAYRLRKARLTVAGREPVLVEVRKLLPRIPPAGKYVLLPPVNEFNTAYLKEKKNDPL